MSFPNLKTLGSATFNLAYIPDEFNLKAKEPFDPEYMVKLFDLGYRMALSGYPWDKTPPGF
ncbi:MAG: hypothetical protein KAI86_13160 [Desulfobacterales bacterium]|nr:hypothetical protein [Desulfobacterales bacterium]